MRRRTRPRLGAGLWACLFLMACALPGPATPPRLQTLAAGIAPEPRDPRAAMPSWINDVRPAVPRLSEDEEKAASQGIRRLLERSHPDHYPQVESLHVVPHLQSGTYVFIARVAVAGFSSYRYRLIGHYDRSKDRITDLEEIRLKPGTESADLCPPEAQPDSQPPGKRAIDQPSDRAVTLKPADAN